MSKHLQPDPARDAEARAFRWITPLLAVLALAAGVAFATSGFALGFLLLTVVLMVATFFAFMIGFV